MYSVTSVTMHDPGPILAFLSDLHTDWFVAHTAVEKQRKTSLPFYLSAYNSTKYVRSTEGLKFASFLVLTSHIRNKMLLFPTL